MYRCETLSSLINSTRHRQASLWLFLKHCLFPSAQCSCAGTGSGLLARSCWPTEGLFRSLVPYGSLTVSPLVQTSHCHLWILDCGSPLTPQQVGVGNCFMLPRPPQLPLTLLILCFKHISVFLILWDRLFSFAKA